MERGNHVQLISQQKGFYKKMIQQQMLKSCGKQDDSLSDSEDEEFERKDVLFYEISH